MRSLAMIAPVVLLTGCTDVYSMLFDPSDDEVARTCGISTTELKQMKAHVRKMRPYSSARLGKCTFGNDDTGYVFVGTINEPAGAPV